MYYGRGPLALKTNEMYAMLSMQYFQDRYDGMSVLLDKPDLLLDDPLLMFTAAFWRFMTPQRPSPSSHAIAVGMYTPDDVDSSNLIESGWAASILAMGGRDECIHGDAGESQASLMRTANFLQFLSYFGLDLEDKMECQHFNNDFSWEGDFGKI